MEINRCYNDTNANIERLTLKIIGAEISSRVTNAITTLVNEVGQLLTKISGSYTTMGKLEFAKEMIKMIVSKEVLRLTLKGAFTLAGHGVAIVADITQMILEHFGYTKTGKAVGLCGNIAGGAIVGGITGGPIGAVVGGVGAAVIWGIGQLIGWFF